MIPSITASISTCDNKHNCGLTICWFSAGNDHINLSLLLQQTRLVRYYFLSCGHVTLGDHLRLKMNEFICYIVIVQRIRNQSIFTNLKNKFSANEFGSNVKISACIPLYANDDLNVPNIWNITPPVVYFFDQIVLKWRISF